MSSERRRAYILPSPNSQTGRILTFEVYAVSDESLGVKGSCTLMIAGNDCILLDPGGTVRDYVGGIPGRKKKLHEKATRRWDHVNDRIRGAENMATLVTHGHMDHWNKIDELHNPEIISRPKKEFDVGNFHVNVYPVRHGSISGDKLGNILMVSVERGNKKLLFTSDAGGPQYKEALDVVKAVDPDVILVDGPYTLGLIEHFPAWGTLPLSQRTGKHAYKLLNNGSSGNPHLQAFYESVEGFKSLIEGDRIKTIVGQHHMNRGFNDPARPLINEALEYAEKLGRSDIKIGIVREFGEGLIRKIPI